MGNKYVIRPTAMLVLPAGEAIFSDFATKVFIEDDGGGEFISLEQITDENHGKISFSKDEWLILKEAIEKLINEIN